MPELYIGLMSGTSLDGVDAVLVDFESQPRLIASHYTAYSDALHKQLATLCQKGIRDPGIYARLDVELGRIFARSVNELIQQSGQDRNHILAIGSHGQTVLHNPAGDTPNSLQIGDPNIITEQTGIVTVADFRRRDMAAGGQGAPLVPAFHNAVLRASGTHRVIVNIGGIANITILPADGGSDVIGFDTGPGNILMNAWSRQHQGKDMDGGGRWAASGSIDAELLERLLRDPYFKATPPKSTGREYFNPAWLNKKLKQHRKRVFRKNVQATLCELTARSIRDAITTYAPDTQEVYVCGGGSHNLALMFRLQVLLGDIPVATTAELDLDPDYIEAMAFAWLARQTLDGRPGNLPSVTGAARPVVLGGIYKS